jgi:hypothetical protein
LSFDKKVIARPSQIVDWKIPKGCKLAPRMCERAARRSTARTGGWQPQFAIRPDFTAKHVGTIFQGDLGCFLVIECVRWLGLLPIRSPKFMPQLVTGVCMLVSFRRVFLYQVEF